MGNIKRISHWFTKGTLLAVLVVMMLPPLVVLASIASPTTFTVNTIDVYQSSIETDDQWYLVTFAIEYGSNPADYTAAEAFVLRLKDSGVEIAVKAPYAYYDRGYSSGVVSFYFAADDADLPTWSTASISVELVGNPSIDWTAGDPPTVTNSVVDGWNVGTSSIAGRLTYIAQQFGTEYSKTFVQLVSGENKFTSDGETYFETTIENLREIAPSLFSDIVTTPTVREITYTDTVKEATEDRWLGDDIFDLSGLADMMGVSRMWITSVAWMILSAAVLFFAAKYIGSATALLAILGMMFIIGSFTGFMAFDVGIWCGVIGVLILVYNLVYKGAT